MLTLTLQCLGALLVLAFGGVALGVSGHRAVLTADRLAGWRLAGIAFSVLGVSWAAQNAGAVAAFASGAGTPVYATYLRWAPALNHSRSLLGTAFAAGMTWIAWTGRIPGRAGWACILGGMALAMLAGGALGVAEGSYDSRVHALHAAVLLTVELIAFSAALLAATARGTFDVFLFSALMLYTASMALSVPLFSAMTLRAWFGGAGNSAMLMQLQSALFALLMLGVAVLRLRLLRRGVRAGEVFGREPVLRLHFLAPGAEARGEDGTSG